MYTILVSYVGFDFVVDERLINIADRTPDVHSYKKWRRRRELVWQTNVRTHAEMMHARLTASLNAVHWYHGRALPKPWKTMEIELYVVDGLDNEILAEVV